ncbi:MAG: hypothetical protein V1748_02380 [Actinomycetota bacterium]
MAMSVGQERLTSGQRERLLRDIWILHDGRWFIKSAEALGFEAATELNQVVTRSMGRTEIKRLLDALGRTEIENIRDFEAIMDIATDIYCPAEHKYELEIIDDRTLLARIIECYVYKNVSKAGTRDIHQCAGRQRFESWLESFSLSGEIISTGTTRDCGGSCDFYFKINW